MSRGRDKHRAGAGPSGGQQKRRESRTRAGAGKKEQGEKQKRRWSKSRGRTRAGEDKQSRARAGGVETREEKVEEKQETCRSSSTTEEGQE